VIIEDTGRRTARADIGTVDVDVLHQLDDGVPAGLVEAMLQDITSRMAGSAVVAHDRLHALVLLVVLRQRRKHLVAGELLPHVLGRLEREVVLLGCAEIDLALGGRKRQRLRPDAVFA